MITDKNLTWHSQVKKVKNKLPIFRKIKQYLPTKMRILYYNYYIKLQLEYCCTIWGLCSKTDIYALIKLQKQAARLFLAFLGYRQVSTVQTVGGGGGAQVDQTQTYKVITLCTAVQISQFNLTSLTSQ